MARKLRIEFPGAVYHLMSRGDRREAIVHDGDDRRRFIETLDETCGKTGWRVHAFVIMPNHVHLVVETPSANLVAGMKWLLGTYTGRFNRRHRLHGHLFAGRYKSLLIDDSTPGYLRTACDYVHLNPARARLVATNRPLKTFAWSSWPAHLQEPSKRPSWLETVRLLGEWDIPRDSPAGRRRLEQVVEAHRVADDPDAYAAMRRGWCLGSDDFRRELLERTSTRVGREHYGVERAESAEMRAERLLVAEMKRLRLTDADLRASRKGSPAKLALAQRLRAETVMTTDWIAIRLQMGSRGYLNHLLYLQRRAHKD